MSDMKLIKIFQKQSDFRSGHQRILKYQNKRKKRITNLDRNKIERFLKMIKFEDKLKINILENFEK